jgi:hypothetical protein
MAKEKTFKGTLSNKQTFAIGTNSYRADAHGCFTASDPEVITFLTGSPFWEEITQEPKPELTPEAIAEELTAAVKKAKA